MKYFQVSAVLLLVSAMLPKADSVEVDQTQANYMETNCHDVDSVTLRFKSCFNYANVTGYTLNMTKLIMSGTVTRETFLAEVASTCRDEKFEETYIKCTRNLLSVCPDLTDEITDIVAEKLSFLCENNQPSLWINNVLKEDFTLTSACFNEETENSELEVIIRECKDSVISMLFEALYSLQEPYSLTEVHSIFNLLVSHVFQCSTEWPGDGDDTLPCGTKKKHLLLSFWINFSIEEPMRPTIGSEAMNQLMVMMQSN